MRKVVCTLSKETINTRSLSHLVKVVFVAALIYQRLELAILNFEELAGLSEFDDVSSIKDHLYESIRMRRARVRRCHDLQFYQRP